MVSNLIGRRREARHVNRPPPLVVLRRVAAALLVAAWCVGSSIAGGFIGGAICDVIGMPQ